MKKLFASVLLGLSLVSSLVYADDWKPYDKNGNVLRTDRDATGKNAVVSTARYEASKIGLDILENGGNAIDAAVGVGFALGVCEPQSSGIGGGGFMIVRFAKTGETKFIDFREIAPKGANPDMWDVDKKGEVISDDKEFGGKSIGVPGSVKGFLYVLEKYGNLDRKAVIQPAIDLANNGYRVSAIMNMDMKNQMNNILKYPATAKIYLKDGKPVASLGGLGAQKIITGITQVIIQMVDYDKDIQEAINFPRIHDAYGELTYEGRIDKNVIDQLQKMGHKVKNGGEWLEYPCIQGVTIKDGVLRGGADPRRDGKALGF